MKYIPYGKQEISFIDILGVVNVLRSEYITQGPKVRLFEDNLSAAVGANYGLAVNSATSALHLSCLALGLSRGDWLWTSAISFVASANCGLYCNAKVDFMEIDFSTGLIDINKLTAKLEDAEKHGKLPKIIIPVHLAGASCDMNAIEELSNKYGFKVIEDASHAIGGTFEGTKVGSCKYSDICVFSFHPVKIITTAEGGAITTNTKELFERMSLLRSHGITKEREKFVAGNWKPWSYEQQILGFNYRMNEIQASLGISQLRRLRKFTAKRNFIYQEYKRMLGNVDEVQLQHIPSGVYSSVHLAMIQLVKPSKERHLNIFKYLRNENIGVQLHYQPIYLQPFYQSLGFKKGYLPVSEQYAESTISIPVFSKLKTRQIKYIVRKIKEALSTTSART